MGWRWIDGSVHISLEIFKIEQKLQFRPSSPKSAHRMAFFTHFLLDFILSLTSIWSHIKLMINIGKKTFPFLLFACHHHAHFRTHTFFLSRCAKMFEHVSFDEHSFSTQCLQSIHLVLPMCGWCLVCASPMSNILQHLVRCSSYVWRNKSRPRWLLTVLTSVLLPP